MRLIVFSLWATPDMRPENEVQIKQGRGFSFIPLFARVGELDVFTILESGVAGGGPGVLKFLVSLNWGLGHLARLLIADITTF